MGIGLSNLIKIIHYALIICILASIIIPNCRFKVIVIILLILLLVKYLFNYNKCGLTQLEYWVLGKNNYQNGLIYRTLNPVINVPENYFNNGLLLIHIVIIIVLVVQVKTSGCLHMLFDY